MASASTLLDVHIALISAFLLELLECYWSDILSAVRAVRAAFQQMSMVVDRGFPISSPYQGREEVEHEASVVVVLALKALTPRVALHSGVRTRRVLCWSQLWRGEQEDACY
jgi:hypothetical protein